MSGDAKKFLFNILIFSLPLVLFIVYFEYRLSLINNSYSFLKQNIESQLKDINVLVLGNSQSSYGINPSLFKCKGFNLSNSSQDLYTDIMLLNYYLPELNNLKLVIFNISYFTLGYNNYDSDEKWRYYFYEKYWGLNYPKLNRFDLKNISLISLYTPQLSLYYATKNFNVNLAESFTESGWNNIDAKSDEENIQINDITGKARFLSHKNLINNETRNSNLKLLEKTISKLNENNINIVFLTPPVYSTYYKNADPILLNEIRSDIENLCSGNKCKYISYFTDHRFTYKDFKNNDHLNSIGAEKFSRIIDTEIIQQICN